MSNTKDFKVKAGIQPTSYFEGVGTVTSKSVGYYLEGASFDDVTASISQAGDERGLAFSTDGTKFYVLDGNTPQSVFQYNLSTAWDLSTSSYSNNSFNISSQETQPTGVTFKTDGTKMYVTGYTGDDVNEYSLSTAWDVSTASFVTNFSVSSQTTFTGDLFFKADGLTFYICGASDLYQYTLSTAWDISTASYASKTVAVSEVDGLHFKDDGTEFFVSGSSTDTVYKYTMTTAWDISTASYSNISFSIASQDTSPKGLVFKDDGTKMFVTGMVGTDVNQYSTVLNTAELDLSTGSVFEVTPTSDIQVTLSNPADSGTVSGATLLLDGGGDVTPYDLANAAYDSVSLNVGTQGLNPYGLELGDSGTKLYSLSAANDTVFQYTLSTAWDLSTASYASKSFNVGSTSQEPESLRFSSDGTRFYVTDKNEHEVNEYTLSTAWDVSTASHSTVLSVSGQGSEPSGIAFKPDGTKMYVCFASGTDSIAEYNLSTAYVLSTASYSQNSTTVDTTPNISGIMFSNDGTLLYTTSRFYTDAINEYSLSTAWDVSTLSYVQNFLVGSEDGDPVDLYVKPDGTKMYMVGYASDQVYQYTLSSTTGYTITYDTAIEWPSGTAPTSPAIGETDVVTFNTRDGGTSYQAVQAIDGAS